jgi:hypothetical protein
MVSASISDWSAPPLQLLLPKFRSWVLVPGRVSSSGAGTAVSGVYSPLDSAAAETITLKIDPGGYLSLIAWLRSSASPSWAR